MKQKVLLFAILLMALAIPQSVKAYDFSKAYQGQMLYYTVIDPVNHYVMLTCPKDSLITNINWYDSWIDGWDYSNRPTGALVLPDTVTHNGMTYIVRAIGACAFSGCPIFTVLIPNTVDSLGDASFGGCNYLSEITFSNALRYIGRYAFHGTNLGSVVLPSQVSVIKEYAFNNARITNITLNNSLQKLERGCLSNNLFTSLNIPASVNDLDISFMSDDWSGMGGKLSSIVVDSNNLFYDSRNNCNAIINSATNQLLVGCKNTVIPESVYEISFFAFDGCSFETFVWPSWIINISVDNCWHGCHFNKLVVSSPTMIMYLCGPTADTIQVLNETPPFLGISDDNGFDFDRPIVVVPCNSISAYQAANGWNNFTHFIEDGIHNVTAQQTEHGTVAVIRPTCANPSATFTATADEGYHFVQWNDGDTNNPRIVPITSDTTLTATFAINQYTVTVLSDSLTMGTVAGGGISAHGTTRTLTATANYGYHFTHWSDGITDATRTVTVTNDITLTAFFAVNQYVVNVLSGDTTMGTVTGSGTSDYNTTRDIAATAGDGYHFVAWSDGNLNAMRTITVTCDTALTAYFALNTYLVTTLSANALMGGVQGGGTVLFGTTCDITAMANYGYHFTQWSDGITNATRTLTVTGDTTLTASFAINQYTVTVVSDNTNMGTVTGSGVSAYQASHSIAAMAATGHHFTHWSDGDSNATRTLNVTWDSTLTAYFAVNQYTLAVESNDVALGSVTGGGTFTHGTQATVSATVFTGHRFDHWSDGAIENPHTITMLNDLNLSALFVEVDSIFVHDTTIVTVIDTVDNFIYDTTIVYDTTILTDTLYVYDTVYIHDTVYVGVDDVETINSKIFVNGGQIVVEGADGNPVALYDVSGRQLAIKQDFYNQLRFDVPASGAYLIKIGNHSARRVIVMR